MLRREVWIWYIKWKQEGKNIKEYLKKENFIIIPNPKSISKECWYCPSFEIFNGKISFNHQERTEIK